MTHAHLDHIGIVRELQENYKIPVYLHKSDKSLSDELSEYCKHFNINVKLSPVITKFLVTDISLKISLFNIKVIHTPGHTPGGVCYLIDKNIFVGDTLFKNSIGRTDLPGGNHAELINSIQSKILTLDGKIVVYPGHGESTNIENETMNNVFFNNE